MRILVVSPFLPYPGVPHAGGKLVYFLLQTLAGKHSVTLVSRYFPDEWKDAGDLVMMLSGLELVEASGPVNAESIPSICKVVWSYYRLARKAREVLSKEAFDICQVEFTETGVLFSPPAGVPAVLTCHDVIAKPAFRRYKAAGGIGKGLHWCIWRVKRKAEGYALSKYSRAFALSDEDREWAERLYPGVPIRVLRYPGGLGFAGLPRKGISGRILFLGALNRPQNIAALRYFWKKVWPIVRERSQDAECRVVGGGIPSDLRREMSNDPRVILTGYVRNIEEEYKTASVFIAPVLTGGGVIVKILDAMAAGVPVVTTPYGNEGIRARAGEEILIGEDPDSFANNVLSLLEDPGFRESLGRAGQIFVERSFSPEKFLADLEETYELLARKGIGEA